MDLRQKFAMEAVCADNFRDLCRKYEISPKTGYKWKERFLKHGLEGMKEKSRRPQSSPQQLKEDVVCEIVRLKNAHKHWGPKKIRVIYGRKHSQVPSESSFKRVLEKAGLTEFRRLRKRQEVGRITSGFKARYENEVWSVDFKGHWYSTEKQRTVPLTVMDESSRYLLELWKMEAATTEKVRARFEHMFQIYGLPERIRSDNGVPFASRNGVLGLTQLSAWWLVLGIGLERGRVGKPQDNCRHERMHLDVAKELEVYREGEQPALDSWRREHNEERPHESLGMKCPSQVYEKSKRRYEGTPEDIEYKEMYPRRVLKTGSCWYENRCIFISTALSGWSVGLEPWKQHHCKVWFGKMLLGVIDLDTEKFNAVNSMGQEVE